VAASPTVTVPLTVAPAAGLVNPTVRDGGTGVVAPLLTVTVRLVLPLRLAESRTLAVRTRLPLPTLAVFQGIDTGPVDVVVDDPTVCPSTLSEYTLAPAPAPDTQTTAQLVPRTVAPLPGAVSATVRPPVPGGGDVVPLLTVTVRAAVPLWLPESVTVAISVWLPLATFVVFQLNVVLAPV
jgi:hypothetical protein